VVVVGARTSRAPIPPFLLRRTHVIPMLRTLLSLFAVVAMFATAWLPAQNQTPPPPTVQQFDAAYASIDAARVVQWQAARDLATDGVTGDELESLEDIVDALEALLRRARHWLALGLQYPEIYGQTAGNFSALATQIQQDIASVRDMMTWR
jgi:hypothetical protein